MPIIKEQIIWINDKRGIALEPWKPEGKETIYSLVPVQAGQGDKYWMEWVRYSKYDKESKAKVQDEKDRPLKAYIGTRADIKALAEGLLKMLSKIPSQPIQPRDPGEDDIPF
jgi:hypothetical protein